MIVVDTSVWINYFNGRDSKQTNLLDDLLGQELILMGDIIYAEILQGFRKETDFRKAKTLLDRLMFAPMLGKEVALQSAQNYRVLRNQGVTVRKTIDVFIATFCIINKHTLLHNDRDFTPFAKHLGLQIKEA